jgi:predicted transglutaminase-like protease
MQLPIYGMNHWLKNNSKHQQNKTKMTKEAKTGDDEFGIGNRVYHYFGPVTKKDAAGRFGHKCAHTRPHSPPG